MHIGHKFLLGALIICAVMFCSARVYADTSGNVTMKVGQSLVKTGQVPDGFNVTREYSLKANDPSNPMPGSKTGGEYRFSLTGDDQIVFTTSGDGGAVAEPAIYFDHAGVYEYTLKPLTGEPGDGYEYEDTVYTVRMYVENNPLKTGDLIVRKIVAVKTDGSKPDVITYHCKYTGPAPDPIDDDDGKKIRTGDTSGLAMWSTICVSMTVMLILLLFRRRRENEHNRNN